MNRIAMERRAIQNADRSTLQASALTFLFVAVGCDGADDPSDVVPKAPETSPECAWSFEIQSVGASQALTLDWSRLTADIVGEPLDPEDVETVAIAVGWSECGWNSASEIGDALCAGWEYCPADEYVWSPSIYASEAQFDAREWDGKAAVATLKTGVRNDLRALALVDFTSTATSSGIVFENTTTVFDGTRESLEASIAGGAK